MGRKPKPVHKRQGLTLIINFRKTETETLTQFHELAKQKGITLREAGVEAIQNWIEKGNLISTN